LAELEIRNLHVRTEDREILRGVDLTVRTGELHALLGPNGSGKSTLANTIMGHPGYEVTEGQILFDGEELQRAGAARARQARPVSRLPVPGRVPGVSVANFLRMAINASATSRSRSRSSASSARPRGEAARRRSLVHLAPPQRRLLRRREEARRDPPDGDAEAADRGARRDRLGLDIDALRTVAEGVAKLHAEQGIGALIITHYQRILDYVKPQFVHILMDGRIVMRGGPSSSRLEREGYDPIREEVGANA
jgi:Fe-S cluster assembly ATP-binding protein